MGGNRWKSFSSVMSVRAQLWAGFWRHFLANLTLFFLCFSVSLGTVWRTYGLFPALFRTWHTVSANMEQEIEESWGDKPRTVTALKAKIKNAWKNIPLQTLQKISDSTQRRLRDCIRLKGACVQIDL